MCSVPDCDEAVFIAKRQMCRRHYNAAYRRGEIPARMPARGYVPVPHREKQCRECGSLFTGSGRQIYCGEKCSRRAQGRKRLVTVRRKPVCVVCGVTFQGAAAAKYCSVDCRMRARAAALERKCTALHCSGGVRARGLCGKHYREARAEEGYVCSVRGCARGVHAHGMCTAHATKAAAKDRVRGSRAEEGQRRRPRVRDAFVAPVDRDAVFQRDGFTCQICGDLIDMTAKMPDPWAPSIDHIIPLACGGTHEPANVQAAHVICNARKGARIGEAA